MACFIAYGSVELRNVYFYIEADTLEEAQQKAEDGDYTFYETDYAEAVNWRIRKSSVELNE